MLKLEVFDPPMCCATGVCGNSIDPKLVTFASDLEWLKSKGTDVIRHGLSFEPDAFVKNEAIKNTLQKEGNDCLPIIIVDEEIVSKGCYPSREKLAEICKIEFNKEEKIEPVQIEESSCCGPDCDCHKSAVSDNFKKVLFIAVLVIMALIIAAKFNCKVGAEEIFCKPLASISQINSNEEVAFVYIPTVKNEKISSKIKNAMISAQNILKKKNITASLYTISPASADYPQIASKTTPPAILTIYKGKGKNYVSGAINQTRLLQSYIAATQEGACGAGCPCHRK